MKQFKYVIKAKMGLHARPSGMLADRARCSGSDITISSDGKFADATKALDIMNLKIKQGTEVQITIEGGDEEAVAVEMEKLFRENF